MKTILQSDTFSKIQQRIESLKSDSKPLWGTMSAQGMLCHCSDQIRMALGEIRPVQTGGILHRTLLKWLVLYLLRAPKGKIQTLPEMDQTKQGTKPQDFEQDRQSLLNYLQTFVNNQNISLFPHAAFGRLNRKEWARMIYLHLEHHLEQFGA